MRVIARIVLVAVLACSGPALAQDEHVAIFKSVSGDVRVMRNTSALASFAAMPLMQSDRIVTGPGATGAVVFKDGTRLTVGASSDIEISQYLFKPVEAAYAFSLYVKKGTVIYSSGKIGKLAPQSVNLNTPRATVGIRGTRFIIDSEEVAQ